MIFVKAPGLHLTNIKILSKTHKTNEQEFYHFFNKQIEKLEHRRLSVTFQTYRSINQSYVALVDLY